MRNKGAVQFFAIALALVSLYQLSFTYFTSSVEKDARAYSQGDAAKEFRYLDSIASEPVYNFFWIKKYTYRECQEREINLGLDLKGGMNVTLEVSVVDVLRSLSGYSKDTTFNKAIQLALEDQKNSRDDFVTLFAAAFKRINPNGKLASVFNTMELREKITMKTSDEDVIKFLREETQSAFDNTFNILRNRIDRFGVTQPNINRLEGSGRVLIELPGVKEPERVRKLLQGTANLEFWETYENKDIYPFFLDVNKKIKEVNEAAATIGQDTAITESPLDMLAGKDTTKKAEVKKDTASNVVDELLAKDKDTSAADTSKTQEEVAKDYPLFQVLRPNVSQNGELMKGSGVGISHYKDTAKVNEYLKMKQVKVILPPDVKFLWSYKPLKGTTDYYELIAIRVTTRDKRAPLDGSVVTQARPEFSQTGSSAEVTMGMNSEGAKIWARLTRDNVGKQIAVVLDNYVYSNPVVNSEITGGRSSITGDFTIQEAQDLANVLKSGKLPAPARIVEEAIVGPSLGKEAISAGLWSFVIAFVGVLLYMLLYYNRAGTVANLALFANVFFTFGVMASLGAVLTLPGIAGMVLTFAMAVDGNVIIYERMREEIRAGKGIKLVVKDGFWHALSAIIDGHVTTILTGVVLFIFGSGPVQGFATTLIIGLLLSLFSSIFIARMIFEWMLSRNMNITVGNKHTINAFTNTKLDFIGVRKIFYVVSGVIITIGIISLFVRGLSYGVDFTGGRTYIVRFDQAVSTQDIRSSIEKVMGDVPEVKTFGKENQVKITTKYKINENDTKTDSLVEVKLFEGIKQFYKEPITLKQFTEHSENATVGMMSSNKVGPTVANDLIYKAFMAVFFGLIIIFIYITIRFRNWQFGLGGVISLFHDTMVIITVFTLFHNILPFGMEVDQSFIAALLTVIGYSIMDSVIIFDRVREYRQLHPRWELKDNINAAINSTLGRTINTSGITLVVLIIIFIFGGEILRGFIFALLVGVAIGTYSSVFNATPIAYDFIMMQQRRKEKKLAKKQ